MYFCFVRSYSFSVSRYFSGYFKLLKFTFNNLWFIPNFSEFEAAGCDALMISEVYLLLDHRKKQSEQKEEIEDMSEIFVSTLNYTQRFSKFKKREMIRAVRGSVFNSIMW
jgi:hypothetical protein